MMWLVFGAAAFAADLDLAAEIGAAPLTDSAFDRFGESNALFVFGGRGGVALTDALTVQLAAHHGYKGADWYSGETYLGAGAFFATDASLGFEAVVPVNEFFAVGGVASGGMILGRTRLDSDPDNKDSTVEITETAVAPTLRTALVTRFTVPNATQVPLQLRVSLGYQWSSQLTFGELGDAALRGMSFRLAFGVQL